jgi:hypothetical protein
MPAGAPLQRDFRLPGVPYTITAMFDQQVQLFGYSRPVIRGAVEGGELGDELAVTLYWQARDVSESLTRFVQLIGPDGNVYGQLDGAPDHGQYPTNLWQPGEVVVEQVSFPVASDLPTTHDSGDYRLHVGFYRPDTLERLILATGEDHAEIPGP